MKSQDRSQRAARRALACAAVTASFVLPTYAQDETEPTQEVIVTGSRIPTPNATSTSPIQVVTDEDIKVGGRLDVSDVISQLPQNFNNDLGQDLGNRTSGLTTAGGVATADLRGLGPNRTLVLVNGRRLGIGSPYTAITAPAPDLDQIPALLLERIDVVTGGASAVYGSDAIAGVVNFITKQNFEGFQIDAQAGVDWHHNHSSYAQQLQRDAGYTPLTGDTWDGHNQSINIVAGTNFAENKGNVTAYFGYLQSDPISSGQRDFGGCEIDVNDDLAGGHCFGTANSNYFRVAGSTDEYSVLGNQFIPWGTAGANPPALFNSQKYIYVARDDRRYNAGFFGHVDLNDHAKPYIEFNFMNDRTNQIIAPSGLFRDSNPFDPISNNYNINCSNPFLSAQQQGILGCTAQDIANDAAAPGTVTRNVRIGRRNIEGGGRGSYYEHSNYRGVVGVKGGITNAWNYDAYGQYYYTEFFNSNDQYFSFTNIGRALLVTGTAANPTCVSGAPCVPYNIFSDGGVTQNALTYLTLSGTGYGTTTLRTIHADITGELGEYNIKLPWATEGLAVNFGYEHRSEEVVFKPDAAEGSGDLAGFSGASASIDRSNSVDEEFIELRAPLIQSRPGIQELVTDIGFRRSDYAVSGAVNTSKYELQYAPIHDLRLRGSYQRAIRAPSIVELFTPPFVGQIQIGEDPCAPTRDDNNNLVAATATLAQCQAMGVTPAQYGNGGTTNTIPQGTAGQLTQLQGGNANLKAEKADTYSFGLLFNPSAVPNLSGSIDYYHINLKGGVGAFPAAVILSSCVSTGDPIFCSQVRRSATGGLTGASVASGGYIIQTNVNVASNEFSGIDLQTNYKIRLGERGGSLGFALNGTYLDAVKTTQGPGVATYDCAGLFGFTCGTVNPRWHHILRTTWATPWLDLSIAATWRYIGKVSLDNNQSNPTLAGASFGGFNTFNARIPAFNYLDLAATWNFRDSLQLRGGVNNVLDKDPPIVTNEIISGGSANTYSVYDILGRQLFVAVTAKF